MYDYELLPTILVVDAESLARRSIERRLRGSGFTVLAASTPERAREIVAALPLCLVVAAYGVRLSANGIAILRDVQARQPACGRVLVADVAGLRAVQDASRAGVFHAVLQRPFALEDALVYVDPGLVHVDAGEGTGVHAKLPSMDFARAAG